MCSWLCTLNFLPHYQVYLNYINPWAIHFKPVVLSRIFNIELPLFLTTLRLFRYFTQIFACSIFFHTLAQFCLGSRKTGWDTASTVWIGAEVLAAQAAVSWHTVVSESRTAEHQSDSTNVGWCGWHLCGRAGYAAEAWGCHGKWKLLPPEIEFFNSKGLFMELSQKLLSQVNEARVEVCFGSWDLYHLSGVRISEFKRSCLPASIVAWVTIKCCSSILIIKNFLYNMLCSPLPLTQKQLLRRFCV